LQIKEKNMNPNDITAVRKLSSQLGCGLSLTKDLLTLAGGNEQLIIHCSNNTYNGVQSLKAAIIDARFAQLEARR
jgi:hypothetical protein